jgi:hypothetical protein
VRIHGEPDGDAEEPVRTDTQRLGEVGDLLQLVERKLEGGLRDDV